MANQTKHLGMMGEKGCVVIFREVPGEPEQCLVVLTESLEGRSHDELMQVVESTEGQEANNLSEVLDRRTFSDGSNMLSTLHYTKQLQKVPTINVDLTPLPNQRINLADVNKEINKLSAGEPPVATDPSHLRNLNKPLIDATIDDVEAAQRAQAQPITADSGAAEGLILQAALMKEDAQTMIAEADAKLAQAYDLNPSLKPKTKAKAKTTTAKTKNTTTAKTKNTAKSKAKAVTES